MKKQERNIFSYNEFLLKIGRKVMDLRLKKQYTRKCLADMADISEKYLYEIEVGKKACSGYILYRLATSLHISLDYLTEYTEVPFYEMEEM